MRSALLAVALVGAVLVGQQWREVQASRALAALAVEQQHAVFSGTWTAFQSACRAAPAELTEFCRAQAKVLRALPQCDASCVQATQAVRAVPTR